jgi:ribosomal protein S18 acetylase RimI-like enzyme
MLRATSAGRFLRSFRFFQSLERAHPQEPHYYLFLLGVVPEQRRIGLGSMLLEALLQRSSREGMPVYLENTNPANRDFYKRHGFTLLRTLDASSNGAVLDLMWRAAPGSNET